MAPKNKFTREEMISAAVNVVREQGADKLTAKTLAARLGISTQPVFTCFETMENVRTEVENAAEKMFISYTNEAFGERIPFFAYGKRYIEFAKKEPELYRLLFLSGSKDNRAIKSMLRLQAEILPTLIGIYKISQKDAERYFRDLWLVVHSIATLFVTGGCPYSDSEIERILTGFSISLIKSIKEIPHFTDGAFDRDTEFRKAIGIRTEE